MLMSIQLAKKKGENTTLCVRKLKFQLSGQKQWALTEILTCLYCYLFVELID